MWAQMITTRFKEGHDGDLSRLMEQLRATEQPGSGLVRSMAMQDQKDPSKVYMFVASTAKTRRVRGKTIRGDKKDCRPRERRWLRSLTERPTSST